MAENDSEQSWLGTFLGYTMLSSDYPSVLRYISGVFVSLRNALRFITQILILLDRTWAYVNRTIRPPDRSGFGLMDW